MPAVMDSTELGAIIRAVRTARGVTRKELARRIGRSEGAVGHWETGERAIKEERLQEIAEALGVEVQVRLVPKSSALDDHAAQVLLRLAEVLPRVPEERRGSLVAQIEDLEDRYPATK